jgi:hypothetical protein
MNRLLLFFFLLNIFSFHAQFAPAVDQIGTSAISKDSAIFQFWASEGIVYRGWQNISDKKIGQATIGKIEDGLGSPDSRVISLGDSGVITLSFPHRIQNGVGPDFAVFENSFNSTYLELAFVEVSSDGSHFIRFPSTSLNPIVLQLGNDAIMEASKIDNLAGKYKGGYGTPFDLEILKDSSNLDVQNVRFVRLIDVVGSINPMYGTRDSQGNLINDPFPTPFPSSGFDLDAVGVINSEYASIKEKKIQFNLWPNPSNKDVYIELSTNEEIKILNSVGQQVYKTNGVGLIKIDVSYLDCGIYYLRVNVSVHKIMIQ